ncbi:protein-glutamate O-methyltransferase CheR [Aestuariibacter sp. AA17]|uniref:protein-glutamate O-methyltransferase n=1 Tax=Fluctibacter corallii TaxID=2984329 RepID=A0ABT3AA57_9ALTE|nr:protein-glutamate O-methyltransferase CheR [Aestuariibacter sp. AA17]MCV2885489.1 protein-glutamate O-methyltransferase CheR [Aestuariibacter sp. AA17]
MTEVSLQTYNEFGQFLERKCGIVLGSNKQYLVRSRLMPLVREKSLPSLTALIDTVIKERDRELVETVLDAMTTNETLWFRDTYPFDLLKRSLLPEIATRARSVKIWSAACSSGQEPYSIAITLAEYRQANPGAFKDMSSILGTDLSADMLKRAKLGEYDSLSIARGLSEERKRQFFESLPSGGYRISDEIKRQVTFRPINLLNPVSGIGKFDIVFCRNVLIYFSAEVKRKILQQIAASLNESGVLFLGASESISGLSEDFDMVRCSPGLYYRKKNR